MKMKFEHLPDSVRKYWSSLSYEEQRIVLTTLGQNFKPLHYTLKVPASLTACGAVLQYLTKHKIPYEAKKVGDKVHFVFDKHGVRNEVLIGMNCFK
jgi:hypothetical protein